tara:strand:+ start:2179 stop:2469 length:291 start_codon:yes stop_codon:yes gene_type:complete
MKEKSISYIKKHLFNILQEETSNILSIISSDYNIDNLDKYIDEDDIKKNIDIFIDKNIRCLGIIKSGAQCARTRNCTSSFCKIHQKTLKFGKVILN